MSKFGNAGVSGVPTCSTFITSLILRVGTSYRTHHKQLHKLTIVRKLSYESHRTSVFYTRTTDEMATSYRTNFVVLRRTIVRKLVAISSYFYVYYTIVRW